MLCVNHVPVSVKIKFEESCSLTGHHIMVVLETDPYTYKNIKNQTLVKHIFRKYIRKQSTVSILPELREVSKRSWHIQAEL